MQGERLRYYITKKDGKRDSRLVRTRNTNEITEILRINAL